MAEQVFRLFVSSPSDVADERRRVDLVVERLNAEFAGRARIKTIRWETSFYSAHDTFQKQIPEANECDVVVALFRARLGTPLPDGFARLPSGEPYPSGTAYEVLSAIEARKAGRDLPDVYVFRHPTAPSVPLDAPDRAEIELQWERLKGFFDAWFRNRGGKFLAAFQDYYSTDDFAKKIEDCLRQWLARHGVLPQGAVWDRILRGSPFPGLAAFEADRGSVFFGRDLAMAQSIERLREAGAGVGRFPFLLVIGASGSGKSSLLRAGLLPALIVPGAIPEIDLWRPAIVTPKADPFLSLAEALFTDAALGPELRQGTFRTKELLAKQLAGDVDMALAPLRDALEKAAEKRRAEAHFEAPRAAQLVLAIDQAERLFVEAEPAAATAFADLLAALVRQNLAYVIMALRSDAYAHFQCIETLVQLREAGATFDLVPPSSAELEEIVRRPVAACAPPLAFEEKDGRSLAALLVTEAKGGDALPLLQMTLSRLYTEEAGRGDGMLRFADYRGMDAAVTETANEALDKLSAEARAELPALVAGLVADVSADPLTGAPVPVVVALDRQAFETRKPARAALVEAFVAKRLLTAEGDGAAQLVRPTHEALLRIWPEAVAIVKETASLIRVRGTLAPMVREWSEARAADKALHLELSPALLDGAQQLLARMGDDLPEPMREFVAGAAAEADRIAREKEQLLEREKARQSEVAQAQAATARSQRRAVSWIATITIIAAALIGWFTFLNRQKAQEVAEGLKNNEALRRDNKIQAEKLTEGLHQLTKRQSELLAETTLQAREQNRWQSAYRFAVHATRIDPGFPKNSPSIAKIELARTLQEGWLMRLPGHMGSSRDAVFSPRGERIVLPSNDNTARIWNTSTGRQIAVLRGHTDKVRFAIFNRDGMRVLTGSEDKTARLWDAATGQTILTLRGHENAVTEGTFSTDGRHVITQDIDKNMSRSVRLWDMSDGKKTATTGDLFDSTSDSVAAKRVSVSHFECFNSDFECLNSDFSKVLIRGEHNSILITTWNKQSEISKILRGHKQYISFAGFTSDSLRVITASADAIKIWDASNGTLITTIKGPNSQVFDAILSSNGKFLLASANDNKVRIWDVKSGEILSELNFPDIVSSTSFSRDGSRILTVTRTQSGTDEGTKRALIVDLIVDTSRTRTLATLQESGTDTSDAAFSPTGEFVITSLGDDTSIVWNGERWHEIDAEKQPDVEDVLCYSPSRKRIVTNSKKDHSISIRNAESGRVLLTLRGHTSDVTHASFSPDGLRLLTGGNDTYAIVWDATTGRMITTLHNLHADTSTFVADGSQIVTQSYADDHMQIWDATTGNEIAMLGGWTSSAHIENPVFSRDQTRIVTDSFDATVPADFRGRTWTVLLWDARTGRLIAKLDGHTASPAFSADGRHVITVTKDGRIHFWDTTSGHEEPAANDVASVRGSVFAEYGNLIVTLNGRDTEVDRDAFSPDGKLVATIGSELDVNVWDIATGRLATTSIVPNFDGIDHVIFNYDSRQVIAFPTYEGLPPLALDIHYLTMSASALLHEACFRRLSDATKFSRDEMRLTGYPDSEAEIDVCEGVQ